jgi:hypothetical protein
MSKRLLMQRLNEFDDASIAILILQDDISKDLPEDHIFCILENPPSQFRIPAGDYTAVRVPSANFIETFEIQGVIGHDKLRFHWGNTEINSDGCPLTGSRFGFLNGKRAVLSSKLAHKRFMKALHGINSLPIRIENLFTS